MVSSSFLDKHYLREALGKGSAMGPSTTNGKSLLLQFSQINRFPFLSIPTF